eukprot:XP_001691925.1 predicted protein [Chlamydomonas reinhardtii]
MTVCISPGILSVRGFGPFCAMGQSSIFVSRCRCGLLLARVVACQPRVVVLPLLRDLCELKCHSSRCGRALLSIHVSYARKA